MSRGVGVVRAPWRALVAVLVAVVLAGCGVPSDGRPTEIDPERVPYGLLGEREAAHASGPMAGDRRARIALVVGDDRIRLVDRSVTAGALHDALVALLVELERGPTDVERRRGLLSTLPSTTRLRLTDLTGGVASVDIGGELLNPVADRLRLTVAQIVLTATSLPGVEAVQLLRDGLPVEAPLVGGQFTSRLLRAEDYAALLSRPA